MKGKIKNIVSDRNFGFIRANGTEYFFHKQDFYGSDWDELIFDVQNGPRESIEVDFDVSANSQKGPRAENVRRL